MRVLFFILLFTFSFSTFAAELSPGDRPNFPKRKLILAGHSIIVEVADTDERRAFGLMYRESLPKDGGMLFIFDDEGQLSFWMQNTLIPLAIGYFGRDRVLNEVIEMKPAIMGVARLKTYPSRKNAMYALEMNAGWFERNKIRPGVQFKFADN